MNIQQENETITAVALAANTDFGRCRLASRIPPALWPIEGENAISRLIKKLANLPVRKTVICCNGNKSIFQKTIAGSDSMELLFLDEKMPFGTAGCIREAIQLSSDNIILAIPSQILEAPDLSEAIARHKESGAILTIISGNNENEKSNVHIYIANREAAEYIPAKGYFDIKENLIPALVRNNKKIIAETLPLHLYSFRNHCQYLETICKYLSERKQDIIISDNVNISSSAKIFGPAIIMSNTIIEDDAIIMGPAMVGRNVKIGKGSLVEQSILWDGTNIKKECCITNCVTEYNTTIPSYSNISNKAITRNMYNIPGLNYITSHGIRIDKIAALLILTAIFAWSYFPEIKELLNTWISNDDYSAGILVPFLAAATIWFRKEKTSNTTTKSIIMGLLIFTVSQITRFFGLYFMYSSAERISILFTLWSMIIILFGLRFFYKNLAAFLFLLLMFPPPHVIHNSIMLPLQRIATSGAAFCIGLFGYAVHREGNILYINNTAVAVSEACNGLRMITAFLIIAVFMSLIIKRNKFEKLSLLLSSLPIALSCNIARLTLTALAFTLVWGQKWAGLIHDFSGYAMVPMAIALVLLEIRVMNIVTTKSKMNIST
jgi:exosortase